MLLVNASKGRSAIHGFGLIAGEPIRRGTIILRHRPGFDLELTDEQVAALSPISRFQVLHYGCRDASQSRHFVPSDDGRFINHSEFPNSGPLPDGEGPSPPWSVAALHNIAPGEEITLDYRAQGCSIDFAHWDEFASPRSSSGASPSRAQARRAARNR
ncbi:MAG TPA: SET domain-containing protein [Bacteroidia bacterium]|nr:SET domain-containing protein [Bacteroidia bacterium]